LKSVCQKTMISCHHLVYFNTCFFSKRKKESNEINARTKKKDEQKQTQQKTSRFSCMWRCVCCSLAQYKEQTSVEKKEKREDENQTDRQTLTHD